MVKDMERSLTPSKIKELSVVERILLVEDIWDSIAAEQELMETTEAQKIELDRRIASYNASPNEGRSFEEIKVRLKAVK
jgi:putative addiction module component (TIGR02574 family)